MFVTSNKTSSIVFSLRVFIFCVALCWLASFASAQQPIPIADIAQTPLELTPTVNPNVMILFDDSGSMDFEIMTSDAISAGLFNAPNPDGTGFGSTDPDLQINHRPGCELISAAFGGYAYGAALPTNHYVDSSGNNCYVAAANAWRFRSVAFNKLYFNPDDQAEPYEPWVGFYTDASGNDMPFSDVPVTAAPLDPFDPSKGTVNLLDADPIIGSYRYYIWDDANGDGLFQEGEQGAMREISNAQPDVQQRFANWFSYYRSRHLRAKAILGKFIADQTGANIGLVRFNFNNLPSLLAEEMNADSQEDEKRTLLDALYSTTPEQLSTFIQRERSPLHLRYIETANYLGCDSSGVFTNNPECPAADAPGGSCQANHIVVASDGFIDRFPFSSFSGGSGIGNEDGSSGNNTQFDGGAFADNISNTFSDVAISFYEEDLHSSQPALDDEVPIEPIDIDRDPTDPQLDPNDPDDLLHQHIKTHVVTHGIPFQADDASQLIFPVDATVSNPSFWLNPSLSDLGLVQDLVHAAYSGRGEYVDVTDNLSDELNTLSQAVAVGIGSTTGVAINTQGTEGNAVLYRTFFDSAAIAGDLVAQEINPDGTPSELNGSPVFLWSAAEQLDVQIGIEGTGFSASRNIITYFDDDDSNPQRRFRFTGANSIDVSQQLLLDMPLPAVGENRLNYIRGQTANEEDNQPPGIFRNRIETDSTGGGVTHNSKLGTIANAAPVFVGAPIEVGRFGGAWPSGSGRTYLEFQQAQANRDPSVIVGANDGMLHMFDADDGSERFAYVPELVFDRLSALTDPEYKHQFYVDSTPSINDAYIDDDCAGLSPCWNTIVVGGLGAGGRGYYAININDPADFVSEDSARQQVMWEFGPEDDPDANGIADSDLGLSFGRPLIAMSNAQDGSGNQRWVAVFGNGYNSTSASGNAIIYMLFIDEGLDGIWDDNDLVKIDTGIGTEESSFNHPNGIADVRAIDTDGNGTIDRLYAGDLDGNLHVVDVSSTSPSDWEDETFVLFEAEYQGTGSTQPITTRPVAVRHPTGTGFIVVFSTGSYFKQSDTSNTDIQSLYGIWDDLSGNEVTADTLVLQELSNETATTGLEVRTVTDNDPQWGLPGNSSGDRGWVINFDVLSNGSIEFPGERAVRALQLRGNVLFVNTVIPQLSDCEPSVGGFGLGLDPRTGSDGNEIIFDINIDNVFDEKDNIKISESISKIVVGTRFKSTPADSTFFGDYRITQLADTSIDSILTNVGNSEFIGRQSWREVEF